MPWLIEAYRTQHGPSFAREVLTVASGEFPDANDIKVFVSSFDESHDGGEAGFWRNADTGEAVSLVALSRWLDEMVAETLGIYGYDEKATLWRMSDECDEHGCYCNKGIDCDWLKRQGN